MRKGIYVEKRTGELYEFIEETLYRFDPDKNPVEKPVCILKIKGTDIFSNGKTVVINKQEFEQEFEYSKEFSDVLVKINTVDEIKDYIRTAGRRKEREIELAESIRKELDRLESVILGLRDDTKNQMEEKARNLKINHKAK